MHISAFDRLRRLFGGRPHASTEAADCQGTEAHVASLSCGDVAARLYDYMDDELDPALKARIRDHLAHGSCECRRALLMELAFDERVRRCVCGHRAPDSLKRRIRTLLAP